VATVEEAKALVNSDLYLEEKAVSSFFKKSADEYGFLIGYTAYDKEKALGLVKGILSHPAQILAEIDVNGSDILIPIVDGLVLEIDKRKKKIVFDVPEGLI
jgi:16S rRNA processing protein RimM